MAEPETFDVAIVGGGPAGSTCGGFIKKYAPELNVIILEREDFPREHVGESQLPLIGKVLNELGVWDDVEAANFPIKVGATYKWGKTQDLWHFNFVPNGELESESRPATYKGQRTQTAFQVDRAVYDDLLLKHARKLGCEVREGTAVSEVKKDGDRVAGLRLKSGGEIEAKWYVDATGHPGLLRRSMEVGCEYPSNLQNVAFWDYWQNAKWAEEIGVGGTRVQVMSLGYGWIWFIPIGTTRTSIGFICPAEYYKSSGMKPEELYRKALDSEPRISELLGGAECENLFTTTKDWSFVAERFSGENWALAGESAGFADPVLAAGLTLAHAGARELAFSIIENLKYGRDRKWLLEEYEARNRRRIMQHIRFADYWYTNNEHFSDLKQFTTKIAADAGLNLGAEQAFQWLGTGGFIDEDLFVGGLGTFSFNAVHEVARRLQADEGKLAYGGFNRFKPDFRGARRVVSPVYFEGRVLQVQAYERDGKVLPLDGIVGKLLKCLQENPAIIPALVLLARQCREQGVAYTKSVQDSAMETLEALVRDGWVTCSVAAGHDVLDSEVKPGSLFVQDMAGTTAE